MAHSLEERIADRPEHCPARCSRQAMPGEAQLQRGLSAPDDEETVDAKDDATKQRADGAHTDGENVENNSLVR